MSDFHPKHVMLTPAYLVFPLSRSSNSANSIAKQITMGQGQCGFAGAE
jgi:hypothetical protein